MSNASQHCSVLAGISPSLNRTQSPLILEVFSTGNPKLEFSSGDIEMHAEEATVEHRVYSLLLRFVRFTPTLIKVTHSNLPKRTFVDPFYWFKVSI